MIQTIDLIWLQSKGSAVPPQWTLGQVWTVAPKPEAVQALIREKIENTEAEAWLFWHSALGAPDEKRVQAILQKPGHVWHAGLKLGTGSKPGLLDYAATIWMLNRDPDPDIEATSWRMSLYASLIKTDVLKQMEALRPGYESLTGAALGMGLRWIRAGVFIRHIPDLVPGRPPALDMELPLADEVRLIAANFPRRQFQWAIIRAAMTRYASPMKLWALAIRMKPKIEEPAPYHRKSFNAAQYHSDKKVTVLIPTIDRYLYLRTLLCQLREQTIKPHEIIVIDQTSKDRRDIRLEMDFADLPLIYLWQKEPGQCTSRNLGLHRASGDYMLLLDDDVEIESDYIACHLEALERHNADATSGSIHEIGIPEQPYLFTITRISDVFPAGNTMLRREVLEKSGLFDLAFNRGQQADGDLGMRVYLAGCLMVYEPAIAVLHHRAPRGGLREHKVREITAAASRQQLGKRRLPHITEVYKMKRYFTPRQVREALWGMGRGTFVLHGNSAWRRALKMLVGAAMLPDTLRQIRDRERKAEVMLMNFPQIPSLESQQERVR